MTYRILVVVAILAVTGLHGLDNGLGLTPPMGWLTWERFRCNTDCDRDPDNCIRLIINAIDFICIVSLRNIVDHDSLYNLFKKLYLSEHLIKAMADIMAANGYRDAGYEYVIIDDCWLGPVRDTNGRLVPDPNRFPSGIGNLSAYVRQITVIHIFG